MKKEEKYFSKFDNSIHKERILARLMQFNYKILLQMEYNIPEKAEILEKDRQEYFESALEKADEYVEYVKHQLKNLLIQKRELLTENSKESKMLIKDINKLIAFYKFNLNYYTNDFIYLLRASISCVQNGKVVPFEKFDEDIKQNVCFECCFDVYSNLYVFDVVGPVLADLYYRTRLIKHDMPIFMTKYEDKLYNNLLVKYFEGAERFPEITDMPVIRNNYNREIMIEKKLYESVFPEFGFKYEDRESEYSKVYTLDFKKVF